MKKQIRSLSFLLLLAACQKGTVQEVNSAAQKSSDGGSMPSNSSTSAPASVEAAASSSAKIGVKNYQQIFRSMAVVTGVSPTDSSIATTYNTVRSQLPQGNDIAALQSSHQSAIVKLASQFCDRLFESTDLRSQLLPDVNFNAAPAVVFTADTKIAIANKLMDRFWGEAPEESADRATHAAQLSDLTDQLLVGVAATSTGTKGVFKGLCTAALSSASFILL